MSPERWERVQDLLIAALDLEEEARSTFLDRECSDDSSLREAVEDLLRAADQDTAFPIGEPFVQQTAHQQPPGSWVRQYQIVEPIGKGGMGVVYKAKDTKLDRVVALKFLPSWMEADKGAKIRFLGEARAAAALEHPNICTIHEVGETEAGHPYIVMAFYPGETLKSILRRGPLATDVCVSYTLKIAEGLAAAHEAGIVHRDVKPGNIMVIPPSGLKLLDFGLAKATGSAVTRTGARMGTAAYMSPEQAQGAVVDARTDIWSLGVVLYEMLAGRPPFSTEFDLALLFSVVHVDPKPLELLRPDIPASLARVVARAMAKDPGARYQSVNEMTADLNVVVADLGDAGRTREPLKSATQSLVPNSSPTPAGGLRILVVDDEPMLELLMRKTFRRRIFSGDWTFRFAENGVEALEILDGDPDIELVLTDLRMPGMDGLTLLSEIEKLDRPLKAVVISAYDDMDNIRTAMNRGAFDFIAKPIDFADLERTIVKTEQELQNIRRARELLAARSRVEADWQVAMDLHAAIGTADLPQVGSFEAAAFTAPAGEIATDFYDFFEIDDDRLGFTVGEVSGSGISAVMFAMMTRPLLRLILQRADPIESAVEELKETLSLDRIKETRLRLLTGVAHADDGIVRFVNAGLPSPSVVRADGEAFSVNDRQVELASGDKLVMATTGIHEVMNQGGTGLSLGRVAASIGKNRDTSAIGVVRDIVRQVLDLVGGGPPPTDMTIAVLTHRLTRS